MDIAKLKALAEAATPGPWQWVDPASDQPCLPDAPCDYEDHDEHAYEFSLRTVEHFPTELVGPLPKFIIRRVEEFHEVNTEGKWSHPDAEYIAAVSPEVVLELIRRIQ